MQVDRKLLGGFVLEFEDRLVDMSQAKKLEEFNNLVTKVGWGQRAWGRVKVGGREGCRSGCGRATGV